MLEPEPGGEPAAADHAGDLQQRRAGEGIRRNEQRETDRGEQDACGWAERAHREADEADRHQPDDVEQVLVPNLIRGVDEFIAGNVDAGFFAIGPAKVAEADAAVGGIRFLPMNEGEDALARMQEAVPSSWIATVQPTQATTGVEAPLPTMHYNYVMFVNADLPDDLVYDLTRILAEKSEDMAAALPLFKLLDPAEMRKDFGVAFHPGAIGSYEEKGIEETRLRS
jgi:uncharacterized protein